MMLGFRPDTAADTYRIPLLRACDAAAHGVTAIGNPTCRVHDLAVVYRIVIWLRPVIEGCITCPALP
jgi:hypothetical protein